MSGIRKPSPISISSPRPISTSRPAAVAARHSSSAAALLLTASPSSAPVSEASSGPRWRMPGAAAAGLEIELEVRVALRHPRHPLDRRARQRRAAHVRVDDHAGRVEHRPQAGRPLQQPGCGRDQVFGGLAPAAGAGVVERRPQRAEDGRRPCRSTSAAASSRCRSASTEGSSLNGCSATRAILRPRGTLPTLAPVLVRYRQAPAAADRATPVALAGGRRRAAAGGLGVALYALWVVRPLTDRGAGVIPPGLVPSLPETPKGGAGQAPAKLPAFGAGAASTQADPRRRRGRGPGGRGRVGPRAVDGLAAQAAGDRQPDQDDDRAGRRPRPPDDRDVRDHAGHDRRARRDDGPVRRRARLGPRHAGGHPAALGQRRRERPGRPHRRAASPRSSSG